MASVAAFLFLFLFNFHCPAQASDPYSASYSSDNDKIFWFVFMSDVHIGARGVPGSENLEWIVTEARQVINPSFMVNTGDLTDSTNWSDSGYPDGPHFEEWQVYNSILVNNGVDENFYYDVPGNHDHFLDRDFDYFLDYSIQGKATGQTQISWTRTFGFGTYHFLGINTAGNDGEAFSFLPPTYGDNAGLDGEELEFIEDKLEENKDADLTMIFGHHLILKRSSEDEILDDVENSMMTALVEGEDELIALMEEYGVLLYGYGHTHDYREEFLTKNMTDGVIYLNAESLTKSADNSYNIVAVDNNGISTISQSVGTWPAVIITAPLDKNLGMSNNPYTSNITDLSGSAIPIRALVFDKEPVTQVEYRMYKLQEDTGEIVEQGVSFVNGFLDLEGMWNTMTQVDASHPSYPYLWEADASSLSEGGDYIIEVRAIGSSTQKDSIPTTFPEAPVDGDDIICFIDAAANGNVASDIMIALKRLEALSKLSYKLFERFP